MDYKQVRKTLGLTQAQMARACNTCLSTWSSWEYDKRQPSGAAERLIELLLDLNEKNEFKTYREKYIDA